MTNKLTATADSAHGYQFAVDGLMGRKEASKFLSIGLRHLDRMISDGKMRKGKSGCKTVLCARSVRLYASSLEQ